VSRYWRGWSK